jgi:GxxExxY protein
MSGLLFEDEVFRIRGAAFEVYNEMGSGFLEAVYQECLSKEFLRLDVPFDERKALALSYKNEPLVQIYRPDFVCFGKIIVELKAVANLTQDHRAQLLNYLKATNLRLGLLINFGFENKVQIERVIR